MIYAGKLFQSLVDLAEKKFWQEQHPEWGFASLKLWPLVVVYVDGVKRVLSKNHITSFSSAGKRWQVKLAKMHVVRQVLQGLDHFSGSPLYRFNC